MTETKDAKSNATEPHACECSRYEIESWIGEVPEGADPGEYVRNSGTGCTATTARTFAMGHDAKLKSLLIRAGVSGLAVRRNDGGVVVTGDAMQMAAAYGFAAKVEHGIKLAAEKAARKAEKDQAVAAAPQPQPKPVRIRVRRWVYDAVLAADGSATYTNPNGDVKTIPADKVVIADES